MDKQVCFRDLSIWLKFGMIVSWIIGAIWLFALGAFMVGLFAGLLA